MKLYNTVEKEGTAEQTIERSRFIAYVKPVSSKEEADDFVAEIRRKHRDATHNVPRHGYRGQDADSVGFRRRRASGNFGSAHG